MRAKLKRGQRELLGRILAIVLILVFALAGVLTATPQTSTDTLTPTAGSPLPATVVFPPVPPGGTPVIPDYIYFHSTGLISLPHLLGWDLAPQNPEETIPSTEVSKITRAGVTFINGTGLSVVHAFSEKDPDHPMASVQALDAYYTKDILDGAWSNFKGGWKELNRKAEGDLFIINFELYLDNNTYYGRQVTKLNQDWMMTLRLVAPGNNPQLLDALQSSVLPKYQLWPQVLNVPLTWAAIADGVAGYVIKYPPDWKKLDGLPGHPYTIAGSLGANAAVKVTLDTRFQPSAAAKTEDAARSWVKATWPKATIRTAKAITGSDSTGFAVSYINPDADGNQNSAAVTLLNGTNGTLYAANLTTTLRDQDLLDPANSAIPVELTQVRNSFFLVPITILVPTLTPSPTIPGAPPVETPGAGALMTSTPEPSIAPTSIPTAVPTQAATLAASQPPTPAPTSIPTAASTSSQGF